MEELTYNLTMNARQYESMVSLLNKIVEQQVEIKESVDDLKTMKNAVLNNIMLDGITLAVILDVSESTLYRWRNASPSMRIPFRKRQNGDIYYSFDEVLSALKQGKLVARGFDRMKAIENMISYREDHLQRKSLKITPRTQL